MLIQMSTLGSNGGFANQIFQYFFLKLVEKELKHEIRYPFWLGAHIFRIPPSPDGLPIRDGSIFQKHYTPNSTPEMELAYLDDLLKNDSREAVDLIGFFQYNTNYLQKYKKLFLEIFSIQQELIQLVHSFLQRIGLDVKDMIAVHVRRGDYLTLTESPLFWCHSTKSIVSSLNEYQLLNSKKKFIFLASDDIHTVSKELSAENIHPITSYDLHQDLNDVQRVIVDFVCLALANNLLISNSSFSFTASMLNQNSKLFLRPDPHLDKFSQFDPWNSPILLNKSV